MFTLLVFLAVLVILVISHEFGHFFAARKNGMRVYEFGFGFPPRVGGWYRDPVTKKIHWVGKNFDVEKAPATVYSLNLFPIGGFVRIKGEDADNKDLDSFNVKPVWRKSIVIVAGVVMNFLVAAILLSVGYMIGLPQPVDSLSDAELVGVKNHRTEVLQVLAGKPAELAGVQSGDIFLQVGEVSRPRLKQVQDYMNTHRDQEVVVKIDRKGEMLEKKIKPLVNSDTGRAGIGVAIVEYGTVQYPWYKALYEGTLTAGWYAKEILLAFFGLIKGIFVGQGAGDAVSGPVGIAVMTGKVARMGIIYLLQFTAMLSLNLAILNILPIPALDGGRLVFLLFGKLRGKPVDEKWERFFHSSGYLLLMLLIIIITAKDIFSHKGAIWGFFSRLF